MQTRYNHMQYSSKLEVEQTFYTIDVYKLDSHYEILSNSGGMYMRKCLYTCHYMSRGHRVSINPNPGYQTVCSNSRWRVSARVFGLLCVSLCFIQTTRRPQ